MSKAGQPPKYKTPEELDEKIQEYFNSPPTRIVGDGVEVPVITITGLAYHLGFASRQSFYDYEKHDKFSYILKKARLRVEQGYEENLHFNNATGSIFALKNMGWSDKLEIDQTNKEVKEFSDMYGSTKSES